MNPGQQVVCIQEDGFWYEPFPKFNEVCTILRTKMHEGDLWLNIKEYNYPLDGLTVGFRASCFAPLISDEVLEAELNSISETLELVKPQ